jgi:hypothetical protein
MEMARHGRPVTKREIAPGQFTQVYVARIVLDGNSMVQFVGKITKPLGLLSDPGALAIECASSRKKEPVHSFRSERVSSLNVIKVS